MSNDPPLSLWQWFLQLMGFTTNRSLVQRRQNNSRRNTQSSNNTDWNQPQYNNYTRNSYGNSVSSDNVHRINEIASRMDRQADRYDNAGDTARAEALYAAASQARETGSYADAKAIEAAAEARAASNGIYDPGVSGSVDNPTSDWSSSNFSDNS